MIFLGNCIRAARKACGLTQQELAEQAGIAVKTVQDIEAGRKNTTYETLCQLIKRLGISANTIFPGNTSLDDEKIQHFLGKFQSCSQANQTIPLSTLDFLSEQLLTNQNNSESSQ